MKGRTGRPTIGSESSRGLPRVRPACLARAGRAEVPVQYPAALPRRRALRAAGAPPRRREVVGREGGRRPRAVGYCSACGGFSTTLRHYLISVSWSLS